MPGNHEKEMVIKFLEGTIEYFEGNPSLGDFAASMWASDGNSVRVLTQLIEGRCKDRSAEGATSTLTPWNCDGGPEKFRDIIKSWKDDEEVGNLLKIMSSGAGHK